MSGIDAATLAQHRAADPGASTWLSANAGSGKTRVLTDRVARLLLRRVPPQNILCLTYTKAAAGEMQNRLFGSLGRWAMMPDDALRGALEGIGEDGPHDLALARTLFARAIETPGGLKIQTIHSFCAGLLRAFPLEAGVPPRFEEMDDSAKSHLVSELLDALAETDPAGAVSGFAAIYAGDEFLKLAIDIVSARGASAEAPSIAGIRAEYGLPPEADGNYPLKVAFDGTERELVEVALPVLSAGSKTMVELAARLAALDFDAPRRSDLESLYDLFLYRKDGQYLAKAKTKSVPTQTIQRQLANAMPAFHAFMERVARAREAELALAAAERTLALRRFAEVLVPAYASAKRDRGWLDFDDLIESARQLLSDREAGAWVRYRLDGKIDHVLVDEAQDTSPAQWRVIELLTEEFGAGDGARDVLRTLFVVGDKKQSIYSFQGADAEMFDAMRESFRTRLIPAGGMRPLQLEYSFRSATAILEAVDAVFDGASGDSLGRETGHLAFFDRMPGRVDLWPLVPKAEKADDTPWYDPVDRHGPENPGSVLAERIAAELHRMIRVDRVTIPVEDGGTIRRRPMTEGDVLILVQGRSGSNDLFPSMIRALKARGLAVAGADRLKIAAELAVRDLTALCAFLALPEDSLSLAAALRSPLFGWSEDDLFRLAHGRESPHLWRVLRDGKSDSEAFRVLTDLRDAADFLRPYDLFERILVRHDGRRKLIARLGPEAEDGIDELLNQALAYERQDVPSLTGFLGWLEGEATEVKRQTDAGTGQVQVMTVHGAKGLERPVVILPDTIRPERAMRDAVLTADGAAHWKPSSDECPARLQAVVDDKRRRAAEERQRLLYVAMTRAASWLVVCGAGEEPSNTQSWYGQVRDGLIRANAMPHDFGFGEGLRLARGKWNAPDVIACPTPPSRDTDLPAWAREPIPDPERPPQTRPPSDLGGAKVLPEETGRPVDGEAALRKGRQIHLLLEHLAGQPPEMRKPLAAGLLAFGEDAADESEAADLADEVGRLLDTPRLGPIFAGGALAEVEVTAEIAELGGTRIHGTIDRLVIGADRVLAVDFKTNRVVPETAAQVPEGLLRQMGAYLSALEQIYTDRAVAVAILWTTTGVLMELPHEIVRGALARPPLS